MPKVRTHRSKPPAGFDLVAPAMEEFETKMRDGKRKPESVWPVFKITHERSKFVYDLYYKRQEISRDLYEWLLRENYADAGLIARWKKTGYERLCCLRCVQTADHSFGTTCICRVPKKKLESGRAVECVHCGCHGCASGDKEEKPTSEE